MPHAVIAGDISLADVHRALEPLERREGGFVHKLGDSYLSRSGKRLLVEAVAVEGAQVVTSRKLLLEVDSRKDGVTVRVCRTPTSRRPRVSGGRSRCWRRGCWSWPGPGPRWSGPT